MNKHNAFAEVIESSLDHYTAQTWHWNHFPVFGSLVEVQQDDRIAFGIVTNIQTGSIDPSRTPFAYQKTEAELLAQQPHIFEFLKTTFTVQLVGYQTKANPARITYGLAPTPCKIHAFVMHATPDHAQAFFHKADFLNVLFAFAHNIPSLDELLLAIITRLITENLLSQDLLEELCQAFSLLTGNDYRRLKIFLQRLETLGVQYSL
jgi:hypothetical protein